MRPPFLLLLLAALSSAAMLAIAQGPGGRGAPGGGQPRLRPHTANAAQRLQLVPATEEAPGDSRHEFRKMPGGLEVSANGIPEHKVGAFPNRNNPHTILSQGYEIRLPADPQPGASIIEMDRTPFGIALNGVLFDPGAAEFWQGDPSLGWQYEALGGAVPLGLDEDYAHVQPTGAYHYHGIPTGLVEQLGGKPGEHSPQLGWAADGYPIYVRMGYSDPKDPGSPVKELKPSWQLKKGNRPGGNEGPGGRYDGAFVQDYEYVAGSGDLDECNGRFCITPEYPEGTYSYFLTDEWPVIPRAFRGAPVDLRGGPGRGSDRGPARRPQSPLPTAVDRDLRARSKPNGPTGSLRSSASSTSQTQPRLVIPAIQPE